MYLAAKLRVEHLATTAPDADAVRWLEGIGDRLHARLAAVDLVKPRESSTLGPWLERYIVSRRGDLKASSIEKLEITRDKLLAHFNDTTPLRAITPNEASEWRAKMLAGDAEGKGKLSEASAKHHVGNAKGIFSEAMRRGLISANPMKHLASGATAAKNDRYVTPDEAHAIVDACPDLR